MPSPKNGLIAFGAIVVLLPVACAQPPQDDVPAGHAAYVAAVEQWRVKHEADYRREYSTIAGLHFLRPGSHRAGSAASNDIVLPASVPATIGRFVQEGSRVRFEPEPGAPVRLGDRPVTAPIDLSGNGQGPADQLSIGNVRLAVHVSGERRSIRVWDPDGEIARAFRGLTWFPVDERHRVTGRFIPDPAPRKVTIPNTFGDSVEYTTEGTVEFTWQDQTLRLRPFTTRPKRLFFVFRDASSGEETYEAARFLYADLQDDGTAVLDFNQAYNPPCAFNPYTTCPLPLRENRLPVRILAGEKAYPGHPQLPTP
jgi:hypothetical protein